MCDYIETPLNTREELAEATREELKRVIIEATVRFGVIFTFVSVIDILREYSKKLDSAVTAPLWEPYLESISGIVKAFADRLSDFEN
jgi:hypothetical protein